MAIKNRQKLINLHTSGTTKPAGQLELGEIAVQHDSVGGARLFIDTVSGGTGTEDTLVEFVPKSYVDTKVGEISSGETALKGRVEALEGKVDVEKVSTAISGAVAALDVDDSEVANQFVTAVSETDGKVAVTRRGLAEGDIPAIPISKVTDLQTNLNAKVNTSDVSTASTVSTEMSASTKVATEKLVHGVLGQANEAAQGYVDAVDEKLGDGFSSGSTVSAQLAAVKATADAAATKVELSAATSDLQSKIDAKVGSVTSGSQGIEIEGNATEPQVSLKLDNSGNVKFSESEGGLKAEVKIPAATVTGVKQGDKVIKLEGTELVSELNLTYETVTGDTGDTKFIILKGVGGAEIAKIDASEFIKDGMVKSVSFNPGNKHLTITFNTDAGTEAIDVDLTSLVDTYTAGNGIEISGNAVSAKVDAATESFLTVGESGLKLSGVQTAINSAKDEAISSAKTYADGLSANYATKAQGAKADTAIQTIRSANDGTYISIVGAKSGTEIELSPSVTVQAVSGATGETKGLAESSDVKSYVDGKVASMAVSASGDAYVEASAEGTAITVNASESTIASLAKADSAVQSIKVTGVSTSAINASVSGGAATLDFSGITIDCGTY